MRGVIETIKHIFAALRLLSVLLFALFLPQVCLWQTDHASSSIFPEAEQKNSSNQEKAAQSYSFLEVLQKIKPFDVGAGAKSLQCILLPDTLRFSKQKWIQLSSILKTLGIDSKPYRYYNATKKQHCSGLRLHITDNNHFSSRKTTATMLTFFKKNGIMMQCSPHIFDHNAELKELRSLFQEPHNHIRVASKVRRV